TQQAPITQLFPYTTLFRSRRDRIDFEIREMDENLLNLNAQNKEISEKLSPFKKDYEKEKAKLDRLINEYNSYEKNIEKNESSLKDRKSTRLNSSHVSISYA